MRRRGASNSAPHPMDKAKKGNVARNGSPALAAPKKQITARSKPPPSTSVVEAGTVEERLTRLEKLVTAAQAQAASAEARAAAAEQQSAQLMQLLRSLQQQQEELQDAVREGQKRDVLRRDRENAHSREGGGRISMRQGSALHSADMPIPMPGEGPASDLEESLIDELIEQVPRPQHPLIVFTDLGGDHGDAGDMLAMLLLRGLEEIGRISLRGLIVHGGDSKRVAMAAEYAKEV